MIVLNDLACRAEDRVEHPPRESASKCILLTRMVRADEGDAVKVILLGVPKFGGWRRDSQPDLSPRPEVGDESDLPERNHNANLPKQLEFAQ